MASRTSAKVTYPEHLQEVELRPSRNTVADDRDTKIALPLSERLRNNLRKRSFEEANLPSLLKERRRKSRISSDSRSGLQENEESDQHASKCAESIIEEHTKQSSQPPETCCFKSCSESIIYGDHSRTEVQTILPSNGLLKNSSPNIRWSKVGEACFHGNCWEKIIKSSRNRNPKLLKKQDLPILTATEKALVKEASQTAEYHDSFTEVKAKAHSVAKLLKSSNHCIVFTGAGISTSAGIGDYRGKNGKWTEDDRAASSDKFDELITMDAADHSLDASRSEETEQRDDDDGVPYEKLRPTYTHEAIVKLLDLGHIKYIISQNGDGLHPLSGVATDRLSELHGNVFKEYCEKCRKAYFRPYYTLDDTASSYYEEIQDDGSTSIKKPKYATQCDKCKLTHRTGRRCEMKGCNGYLIDSIINFGDNLEYEILDRAIEAAKKSDLCLSLGTTMQVTPACDVVTMGKKPLKLVICNRQKTALDYICDDTDKDGRPLGSRIFGDCDPFMRELMKNMMLLKECKEWEAERDSRMTQYDKQR